MVQIYHWIGLSFCELCARKAKLFFQSKLSFQSLRAIPILKAVSSLQEELKQQVEIHPVQRGFKEKNVEELCNVQCTIHRVQECERTHDLLISILPQSVILFDLQTSSSSSSHYLREEDCKIRTKNKYVRRVSDQVPDASDQSQTILATGDRPGLKPSVIALANLSSPSCLIFSNY